MERLAVAAHNRPSKQEVRVIKTLAHRRLRRASSPSVPSRPFLEERGSLATACASILLPPPVAHKRTSAALVARSRHWHATNEREMLIEPRAQIATLRWKRPASSQASRQTVSRLARKVLIARQRSATMACIQSRVAVDEEASLWSLESSARIPKLETSAYTLAQVPASGD